ncbi:MAG: histidine kinase dimerization/phospho-acceptor domain-containing protein [Candidatus Anammoxibacter sp.]
MQTLLNQNIKSEKLKTIRQMGVTINHEINNPLAGVLGNVELLLLDNSLDNLTRNKLTTIRQLSLRIRDVVKKLTEINEPTTIKYLDQVEMIDIRR